MKSRFFTLALAALFCQMSFAQQVITKQADNTEVVNTTEIAKDVKGYKAQTPVEIYIKKGKVVKVAVLPNREGPKYMKMVSEGILSKWNGLKLATAMNLKVDAVTGATYTSNAIIDNVKRGLKYYIEQK